MRTSPVGSHVPPTFLVGSIVIGFQIGVIAVSGHAVRPRLKGHLRQRFYVSTRLRPHPQGPPRTPRAADRSYPRGTGCLPRSAPATSGCFAELSPDVQVGDGSFYDLQIRRVCAVRYEYRLAQSSAQFCLVRCVICSRGRAAISVSSPISLFDLLSISDSMSSARCCDTRTVNIAITASQNARKPAPIRVKKLPKGSTFGFHLRPPPACSRASPRS